MRMLPCKQSMLIRFKPLLCVNFSIRRIHKVAQNSYDSNAALYNQVRPSYPRDAVNFIIEQLPEGKPCKILDLAAGTGIFTKVLYEELPSTASLVAVEPVAGMRESFKKSMPSSVSVEAGTSTSIPFPDDYFDMVTVAQAFHWFSNIESLREINRVLKKDGRGTLALIWNLESDKEEWVGKLRALYEVYDGDVPQYRKRQWESVFIEDTKCFAQPLEKYQYRQEMLVSQEEVWDRVLSKSYITALSLQEQVKLREQVQRLVRVDFVDKFCVDRDGVRCAVQPLDVEVALARTVKL